MFRFEGLCDLQTDVKFRLAHFDGPGEFHADARRRLPLRRGQFARVSGH
jgi:hypothetical protein